MSLPISRLIKRLLAVTATGASMALALATGTAAQAGVAQAGTTAAPGSQAAAAVNDPASLVNPFIGTGAGGAVVGQVDTFPGADAPFGMLQWSPDTPSRPDGGGYNYADSSTLGFSLTHISGPGCAAAGDVPFLPTTGAIGSDPQNATESFSHAQEHASPGYYESDLGSPAIKSQIAVNERSGLGVFTYPATTQANMLIKAGDSANGNDAASVQVVGSNEVTGSSTSGHFCGTQGSYTVYFAAKFSQPFTSSGTWTPSGASAGTRQATAKGPIRTPKLPTAASPAPGTSRSAAPTTLPAAASPATEHPSAPTGPGPVERKGPQSRLQQPGSSGPATGAWVTFDTTSQPVVKAQVSISYVSVANAEANLSGDNPGWDVTALGAKTYSQWQQLLSKFQIGGGTAAQQQTFYTALYHSFVDPALFSDANGQYTGFDNKVHTVAKGQGGEYTDFSGWDIYRSEVPLMAIADPAVTGDAMQLAGRRGRPGRLARQVAAGQRLHRRHERRRRGSDPGRGARLRRAELRHLGRAGRDDQGGHAGADGQRTGSGVVRGTPEPGRLRAARLRPEHHRHVDLAGRQRHLGDHRIRPGRLRHRPVRRGARPAADYAQFMKRAQNWQNQFNPLTGYLQPRDASGNYPSATR